METKPKISRPRPAYKDLYENWKTAAIVGWISFAVAAFCCIILKQ